MGVVFNDVTRFLVKSVDATPLGYQQDLDEATKNAWTSS